MPLSREEAEKHGLTFTHEDDYRSPADPDQPLFAADLTIDGHTEHIQSKSEADVLAQVERILAARGKIEGEHPVVDPEPLPTQSVDLAEGTHLESAAPEEAPPENEPESALHPDPEPPVAA